MRIQSQRITNRPTTTQSTGKRDFHANTGQNSNSSRPSRQMDDTMLSHQDVLQLQRSHGNRATSLYIAGVIQQNKKDKRTLSQRGPFLSKDRAPKKGSKHGRKEGRRQKLMNTLDENVTFDPPMEELVEENEDVDQELEATDEDRDDLSEEDEQIPEDFFKEESKESKKKEPKSGEKKPDAPKGLTHKEVAEEFSGGLVAEGFEPFLSGGAAIHYQGGPRKISDLDFRIVMEKAGFSSFNESKGRALLDYLNNVVIVNSRLKHKGEDQVHGMSIDTFYPMGNDALTIATNNWFGVDISLSLVYFDPEEKGDGDRLVNLKDLGDDLPDIKALSLEELRSDKLKSMITRRKSGLDSVSKVAKDLYDYLTIIRLLNAKEDLKDNPQKKSMSEHLQESIQGKIGEYSYVNHDQRPWHDQQEFVTELMKARAVMTALLHVNPKRRKELNRETRGGAKSRQKSDEKIKISSAKEKEVKSKSHVNHERADAFEKLTVDHEGAEEVVQLLEELSQLKVPKELQKDLADWFKLWNKGPNFAPPESFKKLQAPRYRDRGMPPEVEDDRHEARRPAYDVFDELPEDYLNDKFVEYDESLLAVEEPVSEKGSKKTSASKSKKKEAKPLNENEKHLLKILVASNGFRALGNNYQNMDTLMGFKMSRNQFNQTWKLLVGRGLVNPDHDGLHLTDKGWELFG